MFEKNTGVRSALAAVLTMILTAPVGVSAPANGAPMIGRVLAKGAFRVDNSSVTGNATLFEGATIESAADRPELELASGARISLGPESKGRVFGDHILLERGESRLDKADGFRVEARGLSVQPETGKTTGRIELAGATKVQVAALSGSFRVLNARGSIVARIPAGVTLAFEPQASAGRVRLTGRLISKGGHYLMTDETTNVTVELAGPGLAKLVGKRAEITGSMDPTATPVSDASQYVRVDAVTVRRGGGAVAAGSGGSAGAGGVSGLAISGTTIAIIGGVSAAAVVGGLAAAGGLGGSSTPLSR